MKILILFLINLLTLKIYSQSVSGVVLTQNNEPISMAIVQLKYNENTIAHTTTDDTGFFSFKNIQKGNYLLEVSNWSFEKSSQIISIGSDIKNITIHLQEKIHELTEVEVQSRAALAQRKGDTLTYNLKAVTDGNERKLKELLNKLPGVKTDPITGKITANGKVIDDLLINGQKLFGNNHKLATENINAEMLEEISLINNYEKFSPLKDIEGSEKTAMNIQIKEQFLGKITGDVEVLGAYSNKYKINPKLFQFNKKHSLSIIGKMDNTGQEVMTLFDFIELNSGIKSDVRGESLSDSYSASQIPKHLLSDKNISKKQNQFLSLYSIFQPKENWTINSYFIGNKSNTIQNFLSKKYFYINNLQLEDTQENKIKNFNIQSKINSDYQIGDNTLLNYTFSFSKNEVDNQSNINTIFNTQLYDFKQLENPDYITIGQQFSFIRKITKFSLLSFNAYHEFKKNTDFLSIQSNTDLFNTNQKIFNQNVQEKAQEMGAFGKYTFKFGKNILNINTGYNNFYQNINYQYINESDNAIRREYLFSKASLLHKKTKFEYGLTAEHRYYLNEKASFFVPEAIAKYHFKQGVHTIEGKYKREIKYPNLRELNHLGYAKDFRNYYTTSLLNTENALLQNVYELNYLYINFFNGIHFFGMSRYIKNNNIIAQDYSLSNNTNYITNKLAKGGTHWVNYFNLGINLFKIKQKLEFIGNYGILKTPFYSNTFLDKNSITNKSLEINILSNFKDKKYSYTFGAKFSGAESRVYGNDSGTDLIEYIPKLNVTINLTKNLTGYFNNQYHIATADGFENNFLELNYRLYYQKSTSKWSFYIEAENFLNIQGNKVLSSAERTNYFETLQNQRLAGFIGFATIYHF